MRVRRDRSSPRRSSLQLRNQRANDPSVKHAGFDPQPGTRAQRDPHYARAADAAIALRRLKHRRDGHGQERRARCAGAIARARSRGAGGSCAFSFPARYSTFQWHRLVGCTPCSRATARIDAPSRSVSSTMRRFSAIGQRRRGARCFGAFDPGIKTSRCNGRFLHHREPRASCARRSLEDAYDADDTTA